MEPIDRTKLEPHQIYNGDEWVEVVYMDDIREMPIIEAEPKHGWWINDKGLYKCSVCNNFTITGWDIPIEQMNKTMKYCNNCGARMDGEEND